MQGWFHLHSLRRKQLGQYQLPQGSNGADTNTKYLFYNRILINFWFPWKIVILIIDLFYINECLLWLPFEEFYNYARQQFLAPNIVALILLSLHSIFKIMMTPKLPESMFSYMNKHSRRLLYLQYICRYNFNLLNITINLIFIISFIVSYVPALWLHILYTLKIIQVDNFLSVIYAKIYTNKIMRVVYRITMLTFIIMYISHLIAVVFYQIDQHLINHSYFGDPVLNNKLYYQFNSVSYTPIEMFTQLERYIMALYFGNGLITTIAYGDIVGQNWIQTAFVGVMMVVSTIMVAYLLQEFLIMVQDNKFSLYEIMMDYNHLDQLMTQKKVPQNLKLKIRNYVLYIQYYNKFQNPKTTLQKLTKKMYIDLYQKGYGSYFQEIFSPLGFIKIRKLCQHMEEVSFQPQIQLYFPQWKVKVHRHEWESTLDSEVMRPNLIYLVQGKVKQYVSWQPESTEFQLRRQSAYFFNTFQFLTQRHVRYGLRTKNIVKFVIIKYDDFQEILQQEQEFKKELILMKDLVLCNNISRKLFLDDCQICQDTDHSALNCPQVHYVISHNIEKANKVENILTEARHRRKTYSRKPTKSSRGYNVPHYSVMFRNLSLGTVQQQKQQQRIDQKVEVGVSYLQKTIKRLFKKASLAQNPQLSKVIAVSSYDTAGIDDTLRLQQI